MKMRLDAPETLYMNNRSEPVQTEQTRFDAGQPPRRIMRTVAPDFTRWRRVLFKVNLLMAAVFFLLEAISVMFLCFGSLASRQFTECFRQYILVPTAVNAAALAAEVFLLKKYPRNGLLQDAAALIAMTVICTSAASAQYSYESFTAVFCIPVFASIVFCNKKLILTTAAACLCGLGVSVSFRYAERLGIGIADSDIVPETAVAAAAVLLSLLIAQIINALMSEQKNKLIEAVSEAKRAQCDAAKANSAKSSFLANMSHEIRTPINAILGMNEMILREEHNAAIREYAENIQSSGNLLLSVINDVLDISKIESGNIETVSSDYNISSLINECYIMSASRAREKDLALNVECSEALPRLLSGDEAHIRQIIVNLLTNAVKYTEKGSITLSAGGERDGNTFMLTVSVRDTGIGISEENLGKLFVQFRRFDIERNKNIEGTGLGLTIVKRLADLMGGIVTVKSRLGEGSTFTVSIPQRIVDDTPTGKFKPSYSRQTEYEYVCSFEAPDVRILAVDDLPVNLMVITNMLKDTKVRIDTASSGKEAIGLAEKNHYHLILMDHLMPEMDGVETYEKIKADENSLCADTPVIMLTANALAGVREQYMYEGFSDYISKPVRGKMLEETIMKHLPAELVNKNVSDASHKKPAYEENAESSSAEMAKIAETLPQLNMGIALPYCCGSMELFINILREFSSGKRYEELERQFEEKAYDDYRRNVHTLKSTALTVGLEGLSERARASEMALKKGCTELAEMNHPELMNMYADLLERIRELLKSL